MAAYTVLLVTVWPAEPSRNGANELKMKLGEHCLPNKKFLFFPVMFVRIFMIFILCALHIKELTQKGISQVLSYRVAAVFSA